MGRLRDRMVNQKIGIVLTSIAGSALLGAIAIDSRPQPTNIGHEVQGVHVLAEHIRHIASCTIDSTPRLVTTTLEATPGHLNKIAKEVGRKKAKCKDDECTNALTKAEGEITNTVRSVVDILNEENSGDKLKNKVKAITTELVKTRPEIYRSKMDDVLDIIKKILASISGSCWVAAASILVGTKKYGDIKTV